MKNRYEFNIEDINSARIISLSEGNFTAIYDRMVDEDGNPMNQFLASYIAENDMSKESEGLIGITCPICGSCTFIKKNKLEDELFDPKFDLNHCNEEELIIYSEQEFIEEIYSYMNPDEFSNVIIYINSILIR